MLAIATLLFVLVTTCRTANPCHSDCVPYSCHGPTQYNCEQCGGNMVLEVDTCVCRDGWFTITTKCDTYVANCKTVEVSNGVINCLECLSARDTLVGNACVRSSLPFFLRSSSAGYIASANDKTDATYFVANNCKSLNAAGKCLECYPGGTVNGAGSCVYVASNCLKQDPSGSCIKAKSYNYIVKKNPDTFAQCFGACKTCLGGTYGSCLSCPENYYFVPNANAPGGDCLLCDPACTTCYGPLATDCSSVDLTSFIERSDPGTLNTVQACPANCDWCSSANNCWFCKTKYISMDGLCSTTTNTIPNCLYQYRYAANNTDVCLKYLSSFLTATDGKGYTVTASVGTIQCRRYNFYDGKIISECAQCGNNYLNINGLCVAGSLSSIASCNKIISTSSTARICLRCTLGYALTQSRLACQASCSGASETAVSLDGATNCSPCPSHCTTCTFVTPNLQCTACEVGYELYKGVCLSTSCGDGEITLNKECDPVLTPTTCTTDCLTLDPLACTSASSCTREIFRLVSTGTNTLELSLLPRFADKVAFGPQPATVYDSSNPSALRLICSRLLVDLTDPAAQCTFSPSQLTVTVQVSPGTMRYFSTLSSTTLTPVAVWVARRALTQLAFTVAPRVVVSVDLHHLEKPALITTPPVAPANQDLQLTYELLDPAVCVTTAVFTVTSATVNGVDQPQKIIDANSDLSTPVAGKFVVQGVRLSAELSITQQLLLTFCDGTTAVLTSQTLVSPISQKLFKVKGGARVIRYAAERMVELWFEFLVGTFTDADWIVKIAGTDVAPARLIKKGFEVPGIFVLQYIPEASASGYWLEVGYPNSISEFIRFEKEVPNLFPSFIVPAKAQIAQPIQFWTSFGPQLTFKTLCLSKISDTSYFSTLEKQSSFANNLEQSVAVTDSVSLFLIITSQNPVQILRFDIDIVNTMPQPANTLRSFWELPLTLMFRDGSTMHSSKSVLALGFPSVNWISSIPTLPSPSLTTSSSSGQSTTTPTLSSTGNKLITPLPPLSPQQSTPTTATLTAAYNSGTTPYTQHLFYSLAIYEQTDLQTKELTVYSGVSGVSATRVLVIAEIESLPLRPEKTAIIMPIGVVPAGGAPANGLFVPLPAILPIGRAFAALEISRAVLEAVQPFGQVTLGLEYFDGHAFAQTANKVLGVQAPRTGVSLTDAVDEWSLSLTGILSSLADFELVRSLVFEAHQLNQITARCRFAPGCTAVINTTLATLRWDILTRFMNLWTATTDKSPWLTWENSAMKSSLMNSVGYDANQATDAQITWYWQETLRESQSIIDFTSQKRNSVSRLSFTLGENLKSLGTLTLRNLNLLTSSAVYALQMYAKTYSGFTTAGDCETTLNSVFTLLRGLNEVKLIRYTHVSTSSLFASDLLAIGGLSLIEPLQSSYTVWIGDTVAVELKNLKFNPPLDVYELSVLVIEDGLFDSVATLLDKFNLSSSLNKSRTSVGFTNKFGPVTPQIEPDTEINVYRSDEECRGTPCNRNKQLTSGSSTIILCECLVTASGTLVTPTTTPKPPTPPAPEQPQTFTGTVTKTAEKFSEATSSGAKCLFGSPAKCVPEKRIWMNSVVAIFCLMTFVSLLTCALDSKWLAPFAMRFTVKSQLKVMAEFAMDATPASSSQLQVVLEGQSDPFAQEPEDRALFQRSNSSGGGHSATTCYKELSSDQVRSVNQALNQIPTDPVIDSVLPTMTFSRLSKFQIFVLVALTAHPIASILTSRCKLVSRKTNIFVLYVRWVYELGLSMFFNLGLGQNSPNQYAILFVRCLYSVACVTIFAGIIKKFVRYDTLFNLSAVGFCLPKMPNKKAQTTQDSVFKMETKDSVHTPVSPAVSVNAVRKKNTQRKNWSNQGSIHKISPANSIIVEKKFTLENPQSGVQAAVRLASRAISTEELPVVADQTKGSLYDPADHKCRNLSFIVLSYLTMYILLLGSVFVIIAVSQANDDSGQWPFGYWYVCQFIVSSVFGSTFSIFVQFQLLLYRLKTLRQPQEKTPWLATRHVFFNGEVHELADLVKPPPTNPRKSSETQIKSSSPSLEELPGVPDEQRAN